MCTYGDDSDYLHYFAMSGSAYETNLDHAQSYGVSNVGEDESKVPDLSDGRSSRHTGFNPDDAPKSTNYTIFRDGEWWSKWEWLNQLQNGYRNREEKLEQDAMIERDVDALSSALDLPQNVRDETLDLLLKVRNERDSKLKYGPLTIEVTELGAVSLICRSYTDVPTPRKARESSNNIDKAAHCVEDFMSLAEDFVPKQIEFDRSKVRAARDHLREYYN